MKKFDEYYAVLSNKFKKADIDGIKEYLVEKSGLPGPRANLELAHAFYSYFDGQTLTETFWQFLDELSNCEAETNVPEVMFPFCAIHAFGNLYLVVDEQRKAIIRDKTLSAMKDTRWRIREAAADCCQIIAEKDFSVIKAWFELIYPESNLLVKRGMIAALAHPPILQNKETALYCIDVCDKIMDEIAAMTINACKGEDYIILRKGMEYAPSVFIQFAPEEGFAMFEKYAHLKNPQITRILKSNLSKSRLKKYSEQVKTIRGMIQ